MTHSLYTNCDTPIGEVWVAASDSGVCAVGLVRGHPDKLLAWLSKHIGPEHRYAENDLLIRAVAQLQEYFSGERQEFDIPLDRRGTPFQQRVWDEVARVPYGTVVSYGEIAARIGRPLAARAVGGAMRANPIPIFIPCHRVVGADGTLGGYGAGLDIKAALLRLENALPT